MKSLTLLFAAILAGTLHAQESEKTIPRQAIKKALQWMQHEDPAKRQAAYRSFLLYGKSSIPAYQRTLEKAQTLHEKRLAKLLNSSQTNPFNDLSMLDEELKSERSRIYQLIQTDYKKDSGKVAMLRNEVERLAKLNKKTRKLVSKNTKTLDQSIAAISTAMAEVADELAILEGEEPSEQKPTSEEARHRSLSETFEGEEYLKTKNTVDQLRAEITSLSTAIKANNSAAWANSSQKDFANLLNENRSLFGLTPFHLEERLSAASVGHSVDMATLGFFAHESPVENKKTPSDRARLAKFQHSWTGENIYMGSSSHSAAYDAWFASDGHRFIMFAKGPNLIGVGPHGRHWTMMTGRK